MHITDQIAVVTGGASGLGKACAQKLLAAGARVVIWDKHDLSTADKQAYQGNAPELTLSCDVSDAQSVETALASTISKVGVPRIGIHCAGIAPAQRIVNKDGTAMPLAAFQHVININLLGSFNVLRSLASVISQLEVEPDSEERGTLIMTASIAAFEGQIGQAAYSASKGGVVAMTLPAARELAQHAIRVNTIAPGLMSTPLLLNMPQPVLESLAATVPFPKRLGKPEEFADLAVHIVENTLINGEVIRLDGALRMQAR